MKSIFLSVPADQIRKTMQLVKTVPNLYMEHIDWIPHSVVIGTMQLTRASTTFSTKNLIQVMREI